MKTPVLALASLTLLASPFSAAAAAAKQQVYVTAKFITTPDKNFEKHQVLTDPQFQVLIRALNQRKGADLLSAPSVVTRSGQEAKIEVNREFRYAAGEANGEPQFDSINAGVYLDLLPVIKDDRIKLYGKAVVRTLDTPGESDIAPLEMSLPDGDKVKIDLRGKRRDLEVTSFNTTESTFNATVKDGETILLACRQSDDCSGQLLVAVTARLIDPAGMPVEKQQAGTPQAQGYLNASTLLNVSGYLLSGTPDEPLAFFSPDTGDDPGLSPGVPSIAGVFTDPQFQTIREAAKNAPLISLKKLASQQAESAAKVLLKSGEYETAVTPVVGPDGYTIDLDLAPRIVIAPGDSGEPAMTTRVTSTSITIWDGQWVALSFAAGPGDRPARTFFIQVEGQKS